MLVRNVLLSLIVALALVFIARWRRLAPPRGTSLAQVVIGFVVNFFDTLGIGSFATTTTAYKLFGLVKDEMIVGTLLIGLSLPVVVQAFIFLVAVPVDVTVLSALIAASVLGGWLGAGISSKLPVRPIQLFMGTGLLAAATFMFLSQIGVLPGGGDALTLTSWKLAFALVVNFFLGGLSMVGIGNYAPSLILFSLLGMDTRAAFPIMMGSGAMMAMAGGLRFIKAGRFDTRAALGLTLGGIPGVLLAGLVVQKLPLDVLRWMVVFVVVYAGAMMLRSAFVTPRLYRNG